MSFVPEWSSFCIHMTKSNSSAVGVLAHVVFALVQILMRHSLQTTQFAIRNPERSLFSVYMMQEWNFKHERQFRWERKPEWTHSRLTCTGTMCCFGIM